MRKTWKVRTEGRAVLAKQALSPRGEDLQGVEGAISDPFWPRRQPWSCRTIAVPFAWNNLSMAKFSFLRFQLKCPIFAEPFWEECVCMHTHGCGVCMCVPVSVMCVHIHMWVCVWCVYGVCICRGYRGTVLQSYNCSVAFLSLFSLSP